MKIFATCLTIISVSRALAFTPIKSSTLLSSRRQCSSASSTLHVSSKESTTASSSSAEEDPLGLTPELRKMTNAFESIGDDKLRYKQLLYMANQLKPLENPSVTCIPDNKVPGCLSTVYVDGTATWDDEKQNYVIDYVGDSDGLLTKGLVALLIRGLSGCAASDIQKVNPEFIQQARISQSLTPGRNNGFLNMLEVMKKKALQLEEEASNNESSSASSNDSDVAVASNSSGGPMYNAMIEALQQLQPIQLELKDNSDQHAGHAGSKGYDGESHFELNIVADCFDGLSLVQRHKLIYMLLGEVMPKIHALQIHAKSPSEV